MRRRASTITTTITTATTLMANIDIARLPAPSMASFELQSSLLHPHPLAVSHALSAIETCALLFDVYDLAWKTLCHIHASSSMARRSQLDSAMQDEGCQRGPPQPDPEPAAPPYVPRAPWHPLPHDDKYSHLSLSTWPLLQRSRASM